MQGLHKVLDQQLIKLWNDLYSLTDSYTGGWLSSGILFLVSVYSLFVAAHALLEQTLAKTKTSASDHSSEMTPRSIMTKGQSINVLVTSGSLVPSLAKCLLYRLDDVISANNGICLIFMVVQTQIDNNASNIINCMYFIHFISTAENFHHSLIVYSSWEVGKLQCFSWIKERFGSPNVRFCVIGDGTEECAAAETMRWPFIKIDLRPASPYRFPGLTMEMVQSHIDVIYGPSDSEDEKMKG
ncbi:hypothetical protein BHE74_00028696 [Ensete ventricosum]|nr:hypothetical protein BHE74_00028696 [Ensete ventricosum]